jgi:DNA-binding LytR/AlgR family response regulator
VDFGAVSYQQFLILRRVLSFGFDGWVRTRQTAGPSTSPLSVASEKIDWIEAADYDCCLHVGNRGYMLRESIGDLSEKLDPHRFVRIHLSSVVNLDRIREIYRDGQSEGSIVLTTGATLRMSRSGRQKLMESGRT